MATTNEFIIESDGRIFRRSITKDEVGVIDTILDPVSRSHPRTILHAFSVPGAGIANIVHKDDVSYVTVPLARIRLRCGFRQIPNQTPATLTPQFRVTNEPLMDMIWAPPNTMRLAFLLLATSSLGGITSDTRYFVAYSSDGNAWRLPLPNVYEDGRLCHGQRSKKYPTLLDCAFNALGEFEKSEWNADLWSKPENSSQMFRWTANGEGFTQLPMATENWASLCDKLSVPILERVCLL